MISIALLVLASSVTLFGMYCRNVIFERGVGLSEADNVLFYDMCDYYYRFNDRYGVEEPPVRLQEKRFDMARALDMATVVSVEPPDIDRYTLRPATSTTVHPTWNVDHVALGDMCNWLVKLAGYYLSLNSKTRRPRILAIMNDFVRRYAVAMDGKFDQVFPWGKNWYEFSISSTFMLFYFMLITPNAEDRKFAAELTLKIVTDPQHSLGMKRDNANSVYLALPWITAHYYQGDAVEAAKNDAYRYAVQYIKFPVVERRKNEGLYIDSTYITHTNVLAYGYLSEMTRMSLPLVGLDNMVRNFMLDWRKCQLILGHRSIGYGGIGFHARDRRLTQFTVPDSAFGIQVIPTCLFLRMYGEEYAFSMRGQVPWIAYYESDKTNEDMAQYWVQCRRVFFKGETYTPTFPDIGFIHQRYTDATKQHEVTSRCVISTRTTTTTAFSCGPKRNTQVLKSGFVFAYGHIGILRHFYNCPHMIYGDRTLQDRPASDPVFGRFWMDEYVLCDYSKHTVDIWQKITKARAADFVLHAEQPYMMTKGISVGTFHMTWDCKSKILRHEFTAGDDIRNDLKNVYPAGIEVVNTDNTVMLLDQGRPKMAMYPDDWTELKSNFVTKYNGREYEFVFDSLTNQYWVAGQCIDIDDGGGGDDMEGEKKKDAEKDQPPTSHELEDFDDAKSSDRDYDDENGDTKSSHELEGVDDVDSDNDAGEIDEEIKHPPSPSLPPSKPDENGGRVDENGKDKERDEWAVDTISSYGKVADNTPTTVRN